MTFTSKLRREFTGKFRPAGSVAASMKRGSTLDLPGALTNDLTSDASFDTLTDLRSGQIEERRKKFNHVKDPVLALTAAWSPEDFRVRKRHTVVTVSLRTTL